MSVKRVLVVDDEKNMQTVLKLLFDGEGFPTMCVDDGLQALALLDAGERFGVILSDFKMDGLDGLGLLRGIRERGLLIPFVLVTAHGTIEKAVEAMKLGAVDVVTKPFTKELVLAIVSRIIKLERLEDENQILRSAQKQDELVYTSPAMTEIAGLITRIGPAAAPVLLTGESGTGKEVVARNIHRAYAGGSFDARPFVSVNCPAVPENLLESELFGYRKGAFTGAHQDFKGKVELADGGTVFFDEIGDLPAGLQPKLLRLMENRTYEPLGSGKTKKVDIRVICATNRNLKRLVREGPPWGVRCIHSYGLYSS
jgi:DNA-binding NtrC family response regulator